VIVCFVDIGGIVEHHCLEVIVCFVDIGGIVEHHCLEVIVCFVDIDRLQFDCKHEIQLPMVDPDGDTLKCRWAVGKECDSICNGVPVSTLDEVMTTCIMSIKL
jgi:hypothetical protein